MLRRSISIDRVPVHIKKVTSTIYILQYALAPAVAQKLGNKSNIIGQFVGRKKPTSYRKAYHHTQNLFQEY